MRSLRFDEVDERLAALEKNNTELKMCVEILEDENGFLRDQIATLLKLDA